MVDTVGFNDKTYIDRFNTPHTAQLHTIERFRLVDGGRELQVDLHVEDPGAFTTPWNAVMRYRKYELVADKREGRRKTDRGAGHAGGRSIDRSGMRRPERFAVCPRRLARGSQNPGFLTFSAALSAQVCCGTAYGTMAAADKLLERMRRNPGSDWRIDDFKTVA